jgi:hypothetical protein
VSEAPERSPEREKLAQAITYLAALDRQLERLREARSRLDWGGRQLDHENARRGLDEARRRAPEVLVAKAMNEPYDQTATVEHQQGLVDDARRALDEAAAAAALLADEIKVVGERRELAYHARNRQLDEVVRASPEIATLRDRYEAARQRLQDFSWLFHAIGSQRLPFYWDGMLHGSDNGSGQPWRAAIERLAIDADAELPEGVE